MRITHDAKRGGALCASDLNTVADQRSCYSTAPNVRLDEQGVKFHISVWSREQRSKPNDGALSFRYKDCARSNLLGRHLDRVWMSKQSVTIAGVGERGAQLESFKLSLLREHRPADEERSHSEGFYQSAYNSRRASSAVA